MNAQTRQATIVVLQTQKQPALGDVFSRLGMQIDFCSTVQELRIRLGASTVSGVCVVAAATEIPGMRDLFEELEAKATFEGLRPILIIPRSAAALMDPLFALKDSPWIQRMGLTPFRDIIEVTRDLTAAERESVVERLTFVFNYNAKNPFAARFQTLVKWRGSVRVFVPGRLSWWRDGSRLLGIECGAQLLKGQMIKIQVDSEEGSHLLTGTVEQNLPAELRFNYGNSLSVELTEQSLPILKKIVRAQPNQLMDQPLRRAFIVTRSIALRQRSVRVFSKNNIDCRIPIVKRNIFSDLPMLLPHYLVLEDRVLEDLMAKDGAVTVENLVKVAGHGV